MSEIYQKHNYLSKEINSLIGIPIRVYDMKSGGFSILKKNKVFSEKEEEYLENLPKYERNVYIGKMIKSKNLTKILMTGFIDARKKFIEKNNIKDEDILSIKKDAIFLINKPANKLEFDGYKFKVEDIFSSYYYLNHKEFYFDSNKNEITLKGLSKEILEYHKEFFLDDLCQLFKLNENKDKKIRDEFLIEYRRLYLSRELDLGCYRELNDTNSFRYKSAIGKQFYGFPDVEDLKDIDITYNYIKYIVPLIGMLY